MVNLLKGYSVLKSTPMYRGACLGSGTPKYIRYRLVTGEAGFGVHLEHSLMDGTASDEGWLYLGESLDEANRRYEAHTAGLSGRETV